MSAISYTVSTDEVRTIRWGGGQGARSVCVCVCVGGGGDGGSTREVPREGCGVARGPMLPSHSGCENDAVSIPSPFDLISTACASRLFAGATRRSSRALPRPQHVVGPGGVGVKPSVSTRRDAGPG